VARSWVIRAGQDDERGEWSLANGRAGGGWGEVMDLTRQDSKLLVTEAVTRAYPTTSSSLQDEWSSQLWALRGRVKPGNIVAMPLPKSMKVAIGRVEGDYEYLQQSPNKDRRHSVRVKWGPGPVPESEIDEDLLAALSRPSDLYEVRRANAPARLSEFLEYKGDSLLSHIPKQSSHAHLRGASPRWTTLIATGAFIAAAAIGRLMDFVPGPWVVVTALVAVMAMIIGRVRHLSRNAPLIRNVILANWVLAVIATATSTFLPAEFRGFAIISAGAFVLVAMTVGQPPYEPGRALIFAAAMGLSIAMATYTIILTNISLAGLGYVLDNWSSGSDLPYDPNRPPSFDETMGGLIFALTIAAIGFLAASIILSCWMIIGSIRWYTNRDSSGAAFDDAMLFFLWVLVPSAFAVALLWGIPDSNGLGTIKSVTISVFTIGVVVLLLGYLTRWTLPRFSPSLRRLLSWLRRQVSADPNN